MASMQENKTIKFYNEKGKALAEKVVLFDIFYSQREVINPDLDR